MKFSGLDTDTLCGSGPVDALLLTTCWGGAVGIGGGGGGGGGGGNTGMSLSGNDFLMDTAAHHHQKLVMDSSSNDEDSATKATMDALDNLLLSSSQNSPPVSNNNNNSFAELKPLPPFTGYTGHLSINGISGHHYHAIAAPQSPHSPHQQSSMVETNNNNANAANQNATSSSGNTVFKSNNATLYYTVSTTADQPVVSSSTVDGVVKSEFVDYSTLLAPDSAEDFAAIIGSVLADTTVPNVVDGLNVAGGGNNGNGGGDDAAASRDSWMDLEAWIDTACDNATGQSNNKAIISAESLQEFVASSQFVVSPSPEPAGPSSTLQNLLTQSHQQSYQMQMIKREPQSAGGYHMPLLQSRLQNGPPNGSMKPEPSYMSECPSPSSSTSYLNSKDMMMPHTTTGSPPGHVVSTTDNSLLINGRYQHRPGNGAGNRITTYGQIRSLKATGIPSPDLLVNGGSLDGLGGGVMFPHTTTATTTTPSPSKSKSRSRSNRNKQQQQQCQGAGSVVYASDGAGGLLGKEKPVHRCTVCNRGFLNKSNIKVHLRTHTGEKPFRCEVCGKAFRQKAHLLKHQQIHKRVGRD